MQFFGRELHECFYFCICEYAFDDQLQTHSQHRIISEEINVQKCKIIALLKIVERENFHKVLAEEA